MNPCFSYELTPIPTSLFKDGLMRKANKSMLKNTLTKDLEPCESVNSTMVYH